MHVAEGGCVERVDIPDAGREKWVMKAVQGSEASSLGKIMEASVRRRGTQLSLIVDPTVFL